jgi:hypothetical protein
MTGLILVTQYKNLTNIQWSREKKTPFYLVKLSENFVKSIPNFRLRRAQ